MLKKQQKPNVIIFLKKKENYRNIWNTVRDKWLICLICKEAFQNNFFKKMNTWYFIFFNLKKFFFRFGHTPRHGIKSKLQSQRSDSSCSCDLSHSCGSTRPLIPHTGLGTEPVFQHSQDTIHSIAPQRELQHLIFYTHKKIT